MKPIEKDFILQTTTRKQMRDDLIKEFLKEEPGTGNGDNASKYLYRVETFGVYQIVLERPAHNNKGIDFIVRVNDITFEHKVNGKKLKYSKFNNAPSHDNILDALEYCKNNYTKLYNSFVKNELSKIHNCKIVGYSKRPGASFVDCEGNQHPIEILLLSIKWLFIEQDCTYWNYSGRNMLYTGLKNKNLI